MFSSILAVLVVLVLHTAAATLQVYNPAIIYPRSGYFSLTVDGTSVPVTAFDGYAYAHFSFGDGPAKIKITSLQQSSIIRYITSPHDYGYDDSGVISGNTLTFTMAEPQYIIVRLADIGEIVIAADPLETNVPPSQGSNIFNAVTYGADSGGNTIATVAFNAALQAAGNHGPGGVVYIPPGVFLVGNLVLPSYISLYLAPGSVLRFTGNRADYTKEWRKDSQGLDGTEWIRTAYNSRGIKIYGRGTIDANGDYAAKTGKFIAHSVVPLLTTEFTFDGPIIRDGASWTLMPTRSSFVTIDHAKIFNRHDLGENDAIDVQESQNVLVKNSIGISLDDSFSTKSWPEATGITVAWPGAPQPLHDVTFTNCLAWTRCYGFKVGQGVWQEQQNIRFEYSTVYQAAIGLGIHHKWGTAAAHDIYFHKMSIEHLDFDNDGHQTWLAIFVQAGTVGVVGPIYDVSLWDIAVRDSGTTAALARGVDGALVSNVGLRNIWFKELGRAATSLGEMKITETGYSTGVVVKF